MVVILCHDLSMAILGPNKPVFGLKFGLQGKKDHSYSEKLNYCSIMRYLGHLRTIIVCQKLY